MNKKVPVLIFVVFITIILKTTVLSNFAFKGIKPDIILIMIIIISNFAGSFTGEIVGFSSGILEDLLSMSPLGFNAFINTFVGYVSGITVGKIFLHPLIITLFQVLIGTLIKSLLSFLLLFIFVNGKADSVYHLSFILELLFNIFITPFIFFLLKILKLLPLTTNSRL